MINKHEGCKLELSDEEIVQRTFKTLLPDGYCIPPEKIKAAMEIAAKTQDRRPYDYDMDD